MERGTLTPPENLLQRLWVRPWGPGLKAPRPPLSRRPVEGLGRGEEPQAPSKGAREGRVLI